MLILARIATQYNSAVDSQEHSCVMLIRVILYISTEVARLESIYSHLLLSKLDSNPLRNSTNGITLLRNSKLLNFTGYVHYNSML